MFENFLELYLNLKINRIYSKNFVQNGKKPQSVFWNSYFNQTKRFEELLDLIPQTELNKSVLIADVGCGYGAMYEFIRSKEKYKTINYVGIDININFIREFFLI